MNRITLLAIGGLLIAAKALSQSPPTTIPADVASKIVEGCVAHAKAKGQSHAIAVADNGGHLLAFLRMDGNASGIGDFAVQKAAAVASWRFSTAQMAISAKDTPGFASAPHVVTVPGGLPVFSADGRFLGAVGVSGEAAQDDVDCAEAGIKAAGLSSVRAAPSSQ
jgi:glc operon protein GlcG